MIDITEFSEGDPDLILFEKIFALVEEHFRARGDSIYTGDEIADLAHEVRQALALAMLRGAS